MLRDHPDDARALGCMAICRSEANRYDEATELARRAIAAAPNDPWCHFVLARVAYRRNRLSEAEEAVRRAIELDPMNAEHFALLGAIHLQRKEWQQALAAARSGRRFDPDHVTSSNIEAMALTQLGRREEAERSIRGALRRAPEDARTHANQGWTLLHHGRYDQALEHFREALRLDPTLDWAREGIKEALKARHPVYRVLLRYKLFMNRLRDRRQFAIILVGYLLYRGALALAGTSAVLAPVCWTLVIAYVAFVLLTWFGDPIFNFLLRLNRFGRHALTGAERLESAVICGTLLVATGCLGGYLLGGAFSWLAGALLLAFLCAPLRFVFLLEERRARLGMVAFTAAVLLLGAYTWIGIWQSERHELAVTRGLTLFAVYVILCVFVSQLVAVGLARRFARR